MIEYNKNDSFILLNILDTLDNVNACIVNLTVKQFFSRRCITLIKRLADLLSLINVLQHFMTIVIKK